MTAPIDTMLTQAIENSLADHPAPSTVALNALPLSELRDDTYAAVKALLESGHNVAGIVAACGAYYQRECDGINEATILEAFADRFAYLEAAGM